MAIVWTGGTTGFPKGAWFDHACLEAMSHGAAPLSVVGDRRLSPLPFAHIGAMTRVWDELMHLITTVIVPSPWTACRCAERNPFRTRQCQSRSPDTVSNDV